MQVCKLLKSCFFEGNLGDPTAPSQDADNLELMRTILD